MNAKEPCLEASVIGLAALGEATPVPRGVGSEEFAPPGHGLLGWLDNWFSTCSEERMQSVYMAYWS